MANSTTAFGLRPLGKVSGNPANGGNDAFRIEDNASTSIYQGDLVALTTGYIVPVTSSATSTILGVFNGCLIEQDPSTKKPKWSNFYTQTNITQGIIAAYVYDDPNQVYLVKSTGTAAGNTALGTGTTGYGIVHAAGNTVNGISGVYLNLGSSTTAQLKIMSVSPFIGNEENSTNEDFVVKIKQSSSIL